jgi:SHS2 domain-containing protein
MNGTPPDFEEIEHTADWALRVRGAGLPELLSHAARGMSSLLVPDLAAIPADVERQVELDALDAESLLVGWLGELAYWAESELLVFGEYDLAEVSPTHLRAALRGGRVPGLQKHIKAVTYHNLKIVATEDGLETTVVFDV